MTLVQCLALRSEKVTCSLSIPLDQDWPDLAVGTYCFYKLPRSFVRVLEKESTQHKFAGQRDRTDLAPTKDRIEYGRDVKCGLGSALRTQLGSLATIAATERPDNYI